MSPSRSQIDALDLVALLALWRMRNREVWPRSAKPYRLVGERLRKLGEPLLAFDVVSEGL